MTAQAHTASSPRRLGIVVMVVIWAALVGRTLGSSDPHQWAEYLAGYCVFLVLLLVMMTRPSLPSPVLLVACAVQAAIVLVLLGINAQRDYVNVLFVIQFYEAAVVFVGLPRVIWGAMLVALAAGSLVLLGDGLAIGLARGLTLAAIGVVIFAFVVVGRELEERRAVSERIVGDLRAAEERLRISVDRADELAALEQRARVVRLLEESVAGTLTDVLEASAAARARLGRPEAAAEFERLQELTKQALAQMRRVITELRPTQG